VGHPDSFSYIIFRPHQLCISGGQEFGGGVLIDLLQDFIA
jgi:hypothetical protein